VAILNAGFVILVSKKTKNKAGVETVSGTNYTFDFRWDYLVDRVMAKLVSEFRFFVVVHKNTLISHGENKLFQSVFNAGLCCYAFCKFEQFEDHQLNQALVSLVIVLQINI
jgi:hypothetical protein